LLCHVIVQRQAGCNTWPAFTILLNKRRTKQRTCGFAAATKAPELLDFFRPHVHVSPGLFAISLTTLW
jgi:hypothetical protein